MPPDALSVTVSVPSCNRLSRLSSRAPCPWGEVRTSRWRIRGGVPLGAGGGGWVRAGGGFEAGSRSELVAAAGSARRSRRAVGSYQREGDGSCRPAYCRRDSQGLGRYVALPGPLAGV